jgi:hypothetical protein
VKTDRSVLSIVMVIVILDNEKVSYILIDTAFSGDINVIKKEAENLLRYTALQ